MISLSLKKIDDVTAEVLTSIIKPEKADFSVYDKALISYISLLIPSPINPLLSFQLPYRVTPLLTLREVFCRLKLLPIYTIMIFSVFMIIYSFVPSTNIPFLGKVVGIGLLLMSIASLIVKWISETSW